MSSRHWAEVVFEVCAGIGICAMGLSGMGLVILAIVKELK